MSSDISQDEKVEVVYSPSFKKIYAAGILGGLLETGSLEFILFSDERCADKVLETQAMDTTKLYTKRTIEITVVMNPMLMKEMQKWFNDKVNAYLQHFENTNASNNLNKGQQDL